MSHYPVITAASGRQFAASAVGLVAFIINEQEQILMLSSPKRPGKWEPPNGAYDGNETLLDGLLREIREEAGEQIRVRPLCALHTYTFRYDDIVQYMVSIAYLFVHEGGDVVPGDDMAGSQYRWLSSSDVDSGAYDIIVPRSQPWMFHRAVQLYRLLKDAPLVEQQPDWTGIRNKYGD